MDSGDLIALGFEDLASWKIGGAGAALDWILDPAIAAKTGALLDASNALYAFCCGREVKYIGKTTISVRQRFRGYARPGSRQVTNQHCHDRIKALLGGGKCIRILVFADLGQLQWGAFPINLAAGLEDSLIEAFQPEWNGGPKKQKRSETAERESAEIQASGATSSEPAGSRGEQHVPIGFEIVLGPTYFKRGLINPGMQASKFLGKEGEKVAVRLGMAGATIISCIDRHANLNGSVRLIGNSQQIAQWFQKHFNQGQTVRAQVLNAHTILLHLPADEGTTS